MKNTMLLIFTILMTAGSYGLDLSSASQKSTQKLSPTLMEEQFVCHGSYADWGTGQNGWGYCYEWTCNGDPLNNGNPISNSYCERYRPSHFEWGRGIDGWGYCYQRTPYGVAMNGGLSVANQSCERTSPSHFEWSRGVDGYIHCYQLTPNGLFMNQGNSVPNNYCR